ncbi:hypothetical protein SUDANB105_03218 [Streptomyces sp. enrichment culture]|uniref:DUF3558 domain-containing protein n=1 Tax=Streptomyces sp. enrichment culture TaxID=1795815 RepID=UPI003F577C52
MQRKAYVSGIAALLAALLAGCTGGSDDGGGTDDANPDGDSAATRTAEPGRYRTLPEPCRVDEDTLDSLLPGIPQIADEEQREKAYAGEATLTFDNDRKIGCRWQVPSATATDHLFVDLERVVSYDNAVSDDDQAQQLFAARQTEADLPAPTTSAPSEAPPSPSGSPSGKPSAAGSASSASASSSGSSSPSPSATPTGLQPRVLDDLGDEAFLDDELSSAGSTAKQRTVTVVFRTSNVIVTVKYEEQAATVGLVPDSEEMQDRARKLASQLDDSLAG